MKKLLSVIICIIMLFSLTACKETKEAQNNETINTENNNEETKPSYKIGLMTPTLSCSEDEFRCATRLVEKYPDMIKHVTLPDDFAAEQETGITQITNFADDEDVKALIICYGDSGLLPAIQRVKEKRPDMIVITAPIWDDPDTMAKYIDLCLDTDWIRRGETIAEKAFNMGAKTFIHYSYPTHMSMEELSMRRDMMKETSEKLGMEFVEISAPDPYINGDQATLQFMNEDIPKQIEKYGKDTCIFGSYCPMQDIIISKALELGFIMAEQCCPTPTQGFPAAMNLEISPENAGDFEMINQMIKDKAAEAGVTGRLSTWPTPVTAFFPEFSVEVARKMLEENLQVTDVESMEKIAKEVAGVDVTFNKMSPDVDNYYLIIMDSIIY